MNRNSLESPDESLSPPAQGGDEDAMVAIDFEEEDRPFSWRDYGLEDGLVFVVFWSMAGVVFIQFFTRYVLGSPLGWTEEVARYLLICVGFLAATIGVRKRSHIRIDLVHRYLTPPLTALLVWLVDVGQLVYFITLGWVTWKILPLMGAQKMTSLAMGMDVLYGVVLFSIVVMVLRQAWQVATRHSLRSCRKGSGSDAQGTRP